MIVTAQVVRLEEDRRVKAKWTTGSKDICRI